MKKQIMFFLPVFLAELIIVVFQPFGLSLSHCLAINVYVMVVFYGLSSYRLYDVIQKDYPEVVAKRGGSIANMPLMIEQDEGDERLRKLYWHTLWANALVVVWSIGMPVLLALLMSSE